MLDPSVNPQVNESPVLLVIDNFDSFTYNLVQYFGQLGVEQRVFRNNEITPEQALALKPDLVMLSPGPGSPNEAGVSLDIIKAFAGVKPIFGVCLGHQSIGHYFGGRVVRADRLMHGKTSPIRHKGTDLFKGLPQNFKATRYHSLIVERDSLPDCLEITADTAEGEIMGLRHKTLPVYGVQFHPESIATENGMLILKNFLALGSA
ncbi:MAG: aminodeoxychorismate/anthranilate synthase component II [Opitutaceae bacterium]|jgi:anthranilate synthase/aminodeoxychorismate synthase-like glutamine amidotransferase